MPHAPRSKTSIKNAADHTPQPGVVYLDHDGGDYWSINSRGSWTMLSPSEGVETIFHNETWERIVGNYGPIEIVENPEPWISRVLGSV